MKIYNSFLDLLEKAWHYEYCSRRLRTEEIHAAVMGNTSSGSSTPAETVVRTPFGGASRRLSNTRRPPSIAERINQRSDADRVSARRCQIICISDPAGIQRDYYRRYTQTTSNPLA